jgi:Tfp pilus tip-associated adhesin PilY1
LTVTSDEGTDTRTNSSYVSTTHPWLVNIDQNEGTGVSAWNDIRVLTDNLPHYCTEADVTSGQQKNPGPCPDDPETLSINESDPAVYPVHLGWYFNLPTPRERVVVNTDIRRGIAWIISHVPQETMCSAEGYSWIMAIDAASGGRTKTATFDANLDEKINTEDLVKIGTEWVSVSAVKIEKRVYLPGRLRDKDTEKLYFDVEKKPIDTLPPRLGVLIWQEMN